MLKKRGFRLLGVGAAILAVAFVAAPAGAVPMGITAATYDVTVTDPITDDANLASITAGTTYTVLTGATSGGCRWRRDRWLYIPYRCWRFTGKS